VADEDLDLTQYRPGSSVAEMPISLEAREIVAVPSANRHVFVLGEASHVVVDALKSVPGVAVLPPADLFAHGLQLVLNNYVAGMHVGYAMSSLADADTFLLAARALADDVYDAARAARGAEVVVDASPGNAEFARAIAALYPDAVIVDKASTADDVVARVRATVAMLANRPAPLPVQRPRLAGPPIFVLGCPRSGTTWLQSMLDAHPAIGGPKEETAIFASVHELVVNRALDAWISRDELTAAMRRFAESLFVHCLATEAPTATRFLEKTPHHALHLATIAAVFPEASIVGIYRDGRDVVRSIIEQPFGTNDARRAASGWVNFTKGVDGFARARPTQCQHLRYETLVETPIERIGDLLNWLDLAPDEAVLDELRRRSTKRVSKYAEWTGLKPADLRTVYRIAGRQLEALGYVSAEDLRHVKRQPAYVVDLGAGAARKVAKRLMRNR
jgi:hypothetical protein